MSGLLVRQERREVDRLSQRIALGRRELHVCTSDLHAQVDAPLRNPWVLPSCFAAGFVAGRLGWKAGSLVGFLPFYRLSVWLGRVIDW